MWCAASLVLLLLAFLSGQVIPVRRLIELQLGRATALMPIFTVSLLGVLLADCLRANDELGPR